MSLFIISGKMEAVVQVRGNHAMRKGFFRLRQIPVSDKPVHSHVMIRWDLYSRSR